MKRYAIREVSKLLSYNIHSLKDSQIKVDLLMIQHLNKLVTVVEEDNYYTEYRGGRYSFPWIAPLYS